MAARKTKMRPQRSGTRGFTVVLEDIRGQFRVFGEALQGMREHMDARFERVDVRLGGLEHEMVLVQSVLLDHGRQLVEQSGELKLIRETLSDVQSRLVERADVVRIAKRVLPKNK